jgi:DNA-binding GntR family transcriptional regulator
VVIKKSKTVREQAYEELKMHIIEGKIKPGTKIIETTYSKIFNISRTPLREAIRMLELEGYVEVQPHGGVTVKSITKEDINEIYKIRIALEGIILEEVIKRHTEKDIKSLENIINNTLQYINTQKENDEIFKLFSELNNILYSIAGLNKISEMIKNITSYLRRFRRLSIESKIRKEIAMNDHKNLIAAIKEKDLTKALELNKIHLKRSRDFIISNL